MSREKWDHIVKVLQATKGTHIGMSIDSNGDSGEAILWASRRIEKLENAFVEVRGAARDLAEITTWTSSPLRIQKTDAVIGRIYQALRDAEEE